MDIKKILSLSLLLGAGVAVGMKPAASDLIEAAKNGDEKEVAKLITNKADVNIKDESGMTPLMWAARNGYINVAKLLIQNNAHVNAKNNEGQTALIVTAVHLGDKDMVRLLLENGAYANEKDNNGKTALIFAAIHGNKYIVTLLLENGAQISTKDSGNMTALSWAAQKGNSGIVQLLLRHKIPQLSDQEMQKLRKEETFLSRLPADIVTYMREKYPKHFEISQQEAEEIANLKTVDPKMKKFIKNELKARK